ncbi:MAG: hypothetical protein IPK20_25815 [Betaproteobacteria bacterium]|nr:hypothetical protein [Betaproteobacteria bacterium]
MAARLEGHVPALALEDELHEAGRGFVEGKAHVTQRDHGGIGGARSAPRTVVMALAASRVLLLDDIM